MSYLVTEIAMEMLGWKFYDTDGIPRPINLEGTNSPASDFKPLNENLDLQLQKHLTFNEKPLCLTKGHCNMLEIMEPTTSIQKQTITVPNSYCKEKFNKTKEKMFLMPVEQQLCGLYDEINYSIPSTRKPKTTAPDLASSTNDLHLNQGVKLSTITQKSPATKKLATEEKPLLNLNLQKQTAADFQLEPILESELIKTALNLNGIRLRFFESLDPAIEANGPGLRITMETYRTRELKNLHKELKNLYDLRHKTEHLCVTEYPKTYSKYLNFSNALSNYESLQKNQSSNIF